MKVLLLNGSAKPNGNTAQALEAAAAVLRADGIETELFQLGGDPIRDCIGCGQCTEKGCHFDDDRVNEFIAKARTADGFIFGTPVYYAHSTYWNSVHGRTPGEAVQDEEGMQTMRNLARNMSWMLRCFALGRENGIDAPEAERTYQTNFVR